MKFFRQNIIADAWAFLTKRQRKVSLIMAAGFMLASVMEVIALSATAIFVSARLDGAHWVVSCDSIAVILDAADKAK